MQKISGARNTDEIRHHKTASLTALQQIYLVCDLSQADVWKKVNTLPECKLSARTDGKGFLEKKCKQYVILM